MRAACGKYRTPSLYSAVASGNSQLWNLRRLLIRLQEARKQRDQALRLRARGAAKRGETVERRAWHFLQKLFPAELQGSEERWLRPAFPSWTRAHNRMDRSAIDAGTSTEREAAGQAHSACATDGLTQLLGDVVESGAELGRDTAGMAVRHRCSIDPHDRHDDCAGGGDEGLARALRLLDREFPLLDLQAARRATSVAVDPRDAGQDVACRSGA